MTEWDNHALLREYAETGSEPAFATLVARHLNLVYSAALRRTGQMHAAEEVAQAVFIILAKKAKSLGGRTVLSGWLYHTAQLTAANYLRGEIRRRRREQEAFMQSTLQEPANDVTWRQIAPQLEEAMSKLGERDRNAIVLRFFENKSLTEVGAALGASEDAAKMRVNRALEKLRKIFAKRGAMLTATLVVGVISANSVQAAPAGLAKTVSLIALAKGTTASASTITLIKGALKLMAWTKIKTAVVAGAVVLLATGTTTLVVQKVERTVSLRQRLPDGSVLFLNKVSFGDRHEFVHGGKKTGWNSPGRPVLVAEFGVVGRNAASNSLVKPAFNRQFRCVIHGETGIDYVEEFVPSNFKKYPDGFFSMVETPIFPRDSKWLWFRVEESPTNNPYGPWHTVADFKVRNPARPANYPWVASPTPVTNTADGMKFVLGEVTVELRPFTPRDIWNHVVTVPTKVYDHGVLLTNWGAAYDHMADASGNWNPILQRHRSLDPHYVWKLEMDFEPESNFPAKNLATVNLPRVGSKITKEVLGQPVTISWDGNWIHASMPTNRPDLALRFVSASDAQNDKFLYPSGGGSQYQFREGYFSVKRGGMLTMGEIQPTKATFAIVPNVHTTFYVQPRLINAKPN